MAKYICAVLLIQVLVFVSQSFLSSGAVANPGAGARCVALTQISQELWTNDVNRLSSSNIALNYQSQIPQDTKTDHANQKLFTSINENKLSVATYQSFLSLLDNYVPDNGKIETQTTQELNEINTFLNAILGTKVFDILLNYLQCRGLVTNQAHLRSVVTKIWFDFYPRSGSSTINDTSGFEHIMVGEYKSSTIVNGFHNWLSFYVKEKSGQINYYGYVNRIEHLLIGATFTWNNRLKSMATFFVGNSPEFDIAIYTLCFLTNPNKICPVILNGRAMNIRTFAKDGHITTAYPEA
uniref:Uridylate-specific endoribonuclease n=1 Tax=Arion vulgaris TaxID=1028688 RepID=A0A0B6Y965_9EUPU